MYKEFKIDKDNFQTPENTCGFMARLISPSEFVYNKILEPTPGAGNLVRAMEGFGYNIITPGEGDFWEMNHEGRYDYVVMNPPFTPMKEAFRYIEKAVELSDNVITLVPWFILINSDRRFKYIYDFGLVSVTHLPRNTFPGCRIQCVILHMKKNHRASTLFLPLFN